VTGPIAEVLGYFEKGGFVMYPLGVGTLVLWYCLGFRFLTLQRGSLRSVQTLIRRVLEGRDKPFRGVIDRTVKICVTQARANPGHRHLRDVLDDACAELGTDLIKGRSMILSIVSVAPLAGLLGTVIGMIETFDSLADMALFSQSGGIAGGISQALFTTQMGLAVAVPGLVIGQLLDKRQRVLENEMERIKDMVCTLDRDLLPSSELHQTPANAGRG
jgi:biopolymer transport protein ExbB